MKIKTIFQYTLSVLCFFAACHVSQKAQEPMQGTFDKQGHRGCRGLMPENTIPAMVMALNLGVTTLELDVVISKDKKVVLSHEPWFAQEITTKPDGSFIGPREEKTHNIFWMDYEQVKTFDVGMKPHPRFQQQQKIKVVKPLLSELIDTISKEMMTRRRPFPYYNIEIKSEPDFDGVFHPKPAEFVELVMAIVKEKGIIDQVIIQSFDFRILKYMHENYPSVRISALVEDLKGLDNHLKELGFIPAIYSPNFALVTRDMIRKCHDRKIQVIPWTVNNKEKISELKAMGVDGIITDYPNLFND